MCVHFSLYNTSQCKIKDLKYIKISLVIILPKTVITVYYGMDIHKKHKKNILQSNSFCTIH